MFRKIDRGHCGTRVHRRMAQGRRRRTPGRRRRTTWKPPIMPWALRARFARLIPNYSAPYRPGPRKQNIRAVA